MLWLVLGMTLFLSTLLLAGCTVQQTCQGPGRPVEGQVLLAITHARLHSDRRQGFDEYVMKVLAELPETPGLIQGSGRKEVFGDQVWTYTVWSDRAAFRRFVGSPLHRQAMKAGAPAIRRLDTHLEELPEANSRSTGRECWRS